jgi:transcriptional regulator with XRE-family HTH domain
MIRLLTMEISDRIKQRMASLAIKGVDITKATGVSSGGVSQWVTGATKPNGEKLLGLARLLKCNPEWLVSGRGELAPGDDSSQLVPVLSNQEARDFLKNKTLPEKMQTMVEVQAGTAHVAFGLIEDSEQFEPAIMAGSVYYVLPMSPINPKMLPRRLLACHVDGHIVVGRMKPLSMGRIALLMPDKSEVVLEHGINQIIGLITSIHNP